MTHTGILIKLAYSFADIVGGNPHNRIFAGVIVVGAAKNRNPDDVLLELADIALEGLLNNMGKNLLQRPL